jgi:hypothetical protein
MDKQENINSVNKNLDISEKSQHIEDQKILLRKMLESNPNMLQELGLNVTKKRTPRVKTGLVISVPTEKVEQPNEIIKVISQTKAKKILEENGIKRTRTITEEQKAQMLDNLKRGRETLAEKRKQAKELIEKEHQDIKQKKGIEPKKEIKVNKDIPAEIQGSTIKYIVKPKKKIEFKKLENPKKFIKEVIDSEDEVSSSLPTDSESEISDTTLLRKIKRNIKTIKKVDKVIENNITPQVQQPRYNLWYS